MDSEIEENRKKAKEENSLYSKTFLKNNLQMKPKKDSYPREFWKNEYKKEYAVYHIDDCECIPEKTEKQKIKWEISNLKRKITIEKNNLDKSYPGKALEILKRKPLFLDTETTGLDDLAQIIELGIVGCNGDVIFESRYNPTVEIDQGAEDVHGISKKSLEKEKIFSDDAKKIKKILLNNLIVIFNSEFDLRLLKNTYKAFNLNYEFLGDVESECAMYFSARYWGATNRYGTISLSNAVYEAGLNFSDFGEAHSAVGDCKATLAVIKKIASDKEKKEIYIKELEEKLENIELKRGLL